MGRLCRFGVKPGLQRISRMAELLGNPHRHYPTIHVAGTNGKGSTCLMLASVLSACGYKTGLFVSPHLHSYRERFQVDGECVSAADLWSSLMDVEQVISLMLREGYEHPTEFEVLTAAAFHLFSRCGVDVAVIEVGMGGTLDSTNVIEPLVSVITSIGLDHTEHLGHTVAEVAANKAGIIKPGCPVVAGGMDREALEVIRETAARMRAPLTLAPERVKVEVVNAGTKGQELVVSGDRFQGHVVLSLPGAYQRANLATAWATLEALAGQGLSISLAGIRKGLASCRWPGRLEIIKENPLVIIDAAHNGEGARALMEAMGEIAPHAKKTVVLGMLDDKDAESFLAHVGPEADTIIVTRPDSARAAGWERVEELARLCSREVLAVEDIEDAVDIGLARVSGDMMLLVTGSFYVLDRARRHLLHSIER